MKRFAPAAASVILALASGVAFAQVHMVYIQHTDIWNVEPNTPYAIWDASSASATGSEIVVGKANDIVDQAPLLAHALYATQQDLTANGKVILPKGGLLIKMIGGEGDWYCTWRYGDRAADSDETVREKRELCLRADGDGPSSEATLESSLYPAMLTILPSVIVKHVSGANPVTLRPTAREAMPARTQLKVHAKLQRADSGKVCLQYTIEPLSGPETCFSAVGQSVELLGGAFTLLARENGSARIRIDRPINVADIRPRLRR